MLFTTLSKLHEAGACTEGYRKILKHIGADYDKDKPVALSTILESNGLEDTLWCLRCTTEPAENVIIEFVCRCAEHVLHFYEDKYPDDKRPRQAIEAAWGCLIDKSPAGRATWAAARAAARAAWAARAAARDAWAAAWAAARQMFNEMALAALEAA